MNYKLNLKQYLDDDYTFSEYKKNANQEFNEYELYCIDHCLDIQCALMDLRRKNNALKELRDIITNDKKKFTTEKLLKIIEKASDENNE